MKFSGNLYTFGFIMGIVKTGRLYAKKNPAESIPLAVSPTIELITFKCSMNLPRPTFSTINSIRWLLKPFLIAGKNTIKNQPGAYQIR